MGKHEITKRAVFLDRDGVLNRAFVQDGRPYPPLRLRDFELYEDVPEGCARLKAAGFFLVVVTNQPDIGRGIQMPDEVDTMHKKLLSLVPTLDRIEMCCHAGGHYGEPCDCRKPKPGMIIRAAKALGIDLPSSYLIGDRWRDVDCAKAAGCHAIFIDRGYAEPLRQQPDVTVKTFAEAVTAVLSAASRNSLPRPNSSV